MKGDFSRLTFNMNKHFRRVLMQQGRVQLDADWNEQTAILLHHMEALTKDLFGEHSGPADIEDNNKNVLRRNLGFEIIVDSERIDQFSELTAEHKKELKSLLDQKPAIIIGKGHYYIDGILCEIDKDLPFSQQPDYPWPKDTDLENGTYLIYADVWERHITYIEDDSIREAALGGPDTAARSQLVWQVKTEKNLPNSTDLIPRTYVNDAGIKSWIEWVDKYWSAWKNQWQPANRGLLKAQAKQDPKKDTVPCIISAEASYRSTENQLYRVEIHNPGKAGNATFKWSRDNGSVVTGAKLSGTELTVDNPRGFTVGLWVELTNDNQELRGEKGVLAKIINIDSDVLSLGPINIAVPSEEQKPTKARLWESDEIAIQENNSNNDWIKLADGVQIQFQPNPENQYRTGDYWLIPARVATGDVEWPGAVGKPEALPPFGIEHHYAPLAIVNINEKPVATDLRQHIGPLVSHYSQPAASTAPPKAVKATDPATRKP